MLYLLPTLIFLILLGWLGFDSYKAEKRLKAEYLRLEKTL